MKDSQLETLEAMTPGERKLFFAQERVESEEYWLQFMIDTNKQYDIYSTDYINLAKQKMSDYELTGEDTDLELAEQYAELAKSNREIKYSIADIRKQRERVQWAKKKLNQIKTSSG